MTRGRRALGAALGALVLIACVVAASMPGPPATAEARQLVDMSATRVELPTAAAPIVSFVRASRSHLLMRVAPVSSSLAFLRPGSRLALFRFATETLPAHRGAAHLRI